MRHKKKKGLLTNFKSNNSSFISEDIDKDDSVDSGTQINRVE